MERPELTPYITPEMPLDADYQDRWAVHVWFVGDTYLEPDGRKWRFIEYRDNDGRDITSLACIVNADTLLATDLSQYSLTQAEALEVAVSAAMGMLGASALSGFMRAGMNSVDIVEKYAALKLESTFGGRQVTRQELSAVMNELTPKDSQELDKPHTLVEPPLLDVSNAARVLLRAA